MAYTDADTLKTYLGITNADDDALLTALIARAQAVIDNFCNRTFEGSNADRKFDTDLDTNGTVLWLDEDIASINSITNGDGNTVSSGNYVTNPRNDTPYYSIELLSSSSVSWETESDGDTQNAITINGVWAHSTTAPNDIIHACLRLAAYMYRQKDTNTFDTIVYPDAGLIEVPQGMPRDVRLILEHYRKLTP